ncbi:MAG TPA: tryptophan--tRNA ligase [Candidatus Paceibacterota bacterium]|jgi:tryptophanyl-tRNA synthetase|nr:tryptophan--tRNA ligase [Candidatus Paceibacterota bacterium]HOX90906.1 tryptophan--tRNA ligase [Candidatus Paceibacterota bacterium]HQC45977.1 tryptophan--tRNA ligase [Candidatus Paceibacterota bacterium]HQO70998.1 tryptophan--tRNA ligase [Candidatus Paceibacterota bacterium]HQQ21872.1 tryptophan--tRNA ligase [Candidatus Paceibacterota bacterium]
MEKRLLSGVKPTNRPHLGNYFGAMRQFVDLQDKYKTFIMIADYHALNIIKEKDQMSQNILDIALDYLAIGLDPKKVIIFKQSDVSAHAELTWIFDTLVPMPFLMRAHAYKDALAKDKEISVGTFNYPVLMAADILLYDTDIVPVGQDQKQHVEYARDIALKYNNQFGDIFKLPEPFIVKDLGVIPGTDGQKMSKSYKNTIPLFGTDEEIKKAVMGIITDSKEADEPKDPEACNIFALHKLFLNKEEQDALRQRYLNGSISYKESKEMLLSEIIKFIEPMRQRRLKLAQNINKVKKILKNGAKKAEAIANKKMDQVKESVGLVI